MRVLMKVAGFAEWESADAETVDEAVLDVARKLRVDAEQLFVVGVLCRQPCMVQLALRAPGGKGGYGTQLKNAARSKMRFYDNSAAKTLDGRRVADVEEELRIRRAIAKKRPAPPPEERRPQPEAPCSRPIGLPPSFQSSIVAGLREKSAKP